MTNGLIREPSKRVVRLSKAAYAELSSALNMEERWMTREPEDKAYGLVLIVPMTEGDMLIFRPRLD